MNRNQILKYRDAVTIAGVTFVGSLSDNPGHLSGITYPPCPLINVGKYPVFSNKKGKQSPAQQHWKWGSGGEVRTYFVSQLFCLGLWVRGQAAIVTWQRSKAGFFFQFFVYLLAISLVSVVALVSVVSFRSFRFVVSGFSTCRYGLLIQHWCEWRLDSVLAS